MSRGAGQILSVAEKVIMGIPENGRRETPGAPGDLGGLGRGEPYRPWFTAGESPEPWFAADPD